MATPQEYINELHSVINSLDVRNIEMLIDTLHQARLKGNTIFTMGNGGSASTSTHLACDLGKNTRKNGWPNFKVMGLADNMAIFSALANDEGYENVFVQQLASFVKPDDVVIGISASGKSPNVLKAIEYANQAGAITVGFTGFDGGKLAKMVDINLHVDSNCIEQVEDVHLMLEHMIATALRVRVRSTEEAEEVENRLDC
jgi:D-sedoheptulose 7-phosphate isomerase